MSPKISSPHGQHIEPLPKDTSRDQDLRAAEQHISMDIKTFPTSLVLLFLLRNEWRSEARLLLSMTWSRTKLCRAQRHSSRLTHQLWQIQFCAQHKLREICSEIHWDRKHTNLHWDLLNVINPALNHGIYFLSEAISKQKEKQSYFQTTLL